MVHTVCPRFIRVFDHQAVRERNILSCDNPLSTVHLNRSTKLRVGVVVTSQSVWDGARSHLEPNDANSLLRERKWYCSKTGDSNRNGLLHSGFMAERVAELGLVYNGSDVKMIEHIE